MFKHAVARVPDLFKQVVGPLALAKVRFPQTSTIWAFFLDPWPYAPPTWIFPKFAGSRTSPISAPPYGRVPQILRLTFQKIFVIIKEKIQMDGSDNLKT